MALIQEEKKGIGGKDVFLINPGNPIFHVSVTASASGIRFATEGDYFYISPEAFNHLAEWLKSWGYV